ncbi:peroxidase 12-like protein [Tanacetum coccineum]
MACDDSDGCATEKDEIIHSLASQRIAFAAMAGKHDTIAALNALNAKNCPTRVFALTVISDGAVSLMPPITSLPPFMADKLQSKPTDHFFASYFREYLKIMEAYMDIILQYKILCSANLKLLVDTSTAIVKVTGVSQQKLSPRIKRNVLTQGERAEHATPGHSGQLNAEYNCSEVIEKTNTNPATEAEDVVIRSALGPGSQRSSECELAAFYAGFHGSTRKYEKVDVPKDAVSFRLMLMHLQILEAQKPPLVKGLSWNYYQSSCPKLESIIKKQLEKVFKKDVGLAAALLRMHFHDCFVQLS